MITVDGSKSPVQNSIHDLAPVEIIYLNLKLYTFFFK